MGMRAKLSSIRGQLRTQAPVDYLRLQGITTTSVKDPISGIKPVCARQEVPESCPECKTVGHCKIAKWLRQVEFWDEPAPVPVRVFLQKFKFQCSVCAHKFTVPLSFMAQGHDQMTERLRKFVFKLFADDFENVKVQIQTGMDEGSVRILRNEYHQQFNTGSALVYPPVVSFDDWYFRRKVFHTIVTGLMPNFPVDLLETRRKKILLKILAAACANPGEVKIILIDMSQTYLAVVLSFFKKSIVLIDHFHVKQALVENFLKVIQSAKEEIEKHEIGSAMEKIQSAGINFEEAGKVLEAARKRAELIMKQLGGDKKLFVTRKTLSEKAAIRRDSWLMNLSLLNWAWEYKESVFDIWATAKTSIEARSRFDAWVNNIPQELKPFFSDWVATVNNWGAYIFPWFDIPFRPTSAYTETMVGKVKSWKRKGKRQFQTLRDMLRAYAHKKRQEAEENKPARSGDNSATASDWDAATTLRRIKEEQSKFAKSRKRKHPTEAAASPLQAEFDQGPEESDGVASRLHRS